MTICPYCKYDFQVNSSSVLTRKFCSVSCRHSMNQYEKQLRTLHKRLINKIFAKPESIRVRQYHNKPNLKDHIHNDSFCNICAEYINKLNEWRNRDVI